MLSIDVKGRKVIYKEIKNSKALGKAIVLTVMICVNYKFKRGKNCIFIVQQLN